MEETSSLQKNECLQNSVDRLHDEVLISIVSLLSVKEAGHLCILPLGLSTCESLVALCLTKVHVTQEILKFFTSNCPILEQLREQNGDDFENLTINSQESRLRRLEIINCENCFELGLCLPNLVSCTFSGFSTTLVLKDVSSLANLSLGAVLPDVLFNNLLNISGYLSRLEMLTLCTRISKTAEDLVLPSLPRLKKLVLDLDAVHSDSFLSCTPLNIINAAPFVHEIVMKLTCWPSPLMQRKARHPNIGEKHHGLKVFEMVGFAHVAVAVEVALYVLEYAASLEKVVVNGIATTGRGIDLFKQDLATHSCFLDNQYAQYPYGSSI